MATENDPLQKDQANSPGPALVSAGIDWDGPVIPLPKASALSTAKTGQQPSLSPVGAPQQAPAGDQSDEGDWDGPITPLPGQEKKDEAPSLLDQLKDELVGPKTVAGAVINQVGSAAKSIGTGVKEIATAPSLDSGGFEQGKADIIRGVLGDIPKGSRIEKIIKFFNPTFQGKDISPEEFEKANAFDKSPVNSSQYVNMKEHPMVKAALESVEGMMTPENALIMSATGGAGLLQNPASRMVASRLISSGFSAQMITAAYSQVKEVKKAIDAGDVPTAEYWLTHAVMSTAFAATAGAHVAGKPLEFASPADIKAMKAVTGGVGSAVGSAAGAVGSAAGAVGSAAGAVKNALTGAPETVNSLTGKIAQAEPEEIPAASRALTAIDKKGVKTYQDLKDRLDQQVRKNSAEVDSKLASANVTLKPADTESRTPIQGEPDLVSNHVVDTFDQLMDFYDKTNQPTELARVKNLYTKFENNGLSLDEVNDLAREHGTELSGYNANGELASGLKRQAAENTRMGVKEIVRRAMPDDETRDLDSQTSDLIHTRNLVDDMTTKVQNVQNQLDRAGLLGRVGQWTGKAVNIVTGGLVKNVLHEVLALGEDDGHLNAVQIQDRLAKNLKLFDDLSKMSPRQAAQALNQALNNPGGGNTPGGNTPGAPAPTPSPNAPAGNTPSAVPSEVVPSETAGSVIKPNEKLEQIAKDAGLQYRGSDDMGLSHFHDPETNHTFSVPTDKASAEDLLQRKEGKAAPALGDGTGEFLKGKTAPEGDAAEPEGEPVEGKPKTPVQEARAKIRDINRQIKEAEAFIRDNREYTVEAANARTERFKKINDLQRDLVRAKTVLRNETSNAIVDDALNPKRQVKKTLEERTAAADAMVSDLEKKRDEAKLQVDQADGALNTSVAKSKYITAELALDKARKEWWRLANFTPQIEGDVPHLPVEGLSARYTPEGVAGHEYGHVGSEALYGRGIRGLGIFTNDHPESPKHAAAWAYMDYRDIFNKIDRGQLDSDDAQAGLRMLASGGALEHLIDGVEVKDNSGIGGDKRAMGRLLDKMKIPKFMHDSIIEQVYRNAIEDWNHSEYLDIVKKYRSGREADLPETLMASRERINKFNEELRAAKEKVNGQTGLEQGRDGSRLDGQDGRGSGQDATGEAAGVASEVPSGRVPRGDSATEGRAAASGEKVAASPVADTDEEVTHPAGSTVDLMDNPLQIKGTGDKNKITTIDVARALNKYSRKENPALKPGSDSEAMLARAKALAEDEARYQLAQNRTGTEWYTKEIDEHDKANQEMRPELQDPAKNSLFKFAEAILSSGQKPYQNLKSTFKAWDHYNSTGEFSRHNPMTGKSWGPRGVDAYGYAFDTLNRLVKQKGEQGAVDWLLSEHPVKEVREMAPQTLISGKQTDMQPGAMVLGAKRGPFSLNLHKMEAAFTADMWVSRTWNRWMGTIETDPTTGEIMSDAPRNKTERGLMKQAFAETANKLKLTTSSLQAVLWYYEQGLYNEHGTPKESWSFSDAAKRLQKEQNEAAANSKMLTTGKK